VSVEGERDWKRRLKALGLSRKRRPAGAGAAPRPTAPHVVAGRAGEDAAAEYLETHGARLLARNVRYADGEIDLVALCDGALVFVEVKRRRDASRGDAAACVTPKKRVRILRAARRWLRDNPAGADRVVRFDVIAIEDAPARVDWIQGAFDASPS